METGLVISNFVEAATFIRPFCREHLHLREFVKFVDSIEEDCQCDKITRINRAINYYLKFGQLLTPEEKRLILEKNNNKSLTFLYQKQAFLMISLESNSVKENVTCSDATLIRNPAI